MCVRCSAFNKGRSFRLLDALALFLLVLSAGAATPVVTGQWDFRFGDLRATIGADLQFIGDTTNITTFGTMNINGQPATVMSFGANSATEGFYLRHGAKPNGGGHFVNRYTLIMDIMYPASSSNWRALFQTDPFNHPGNDAEFYVGDNHTLPMPDGLGADGQFDGSLAPDTWYRIAFAVDLTAPSGQQLTKYTNGVKAASQSLSGGVDGRYALGPTVQLFTAGLAGGGFTQPGFVNCIQFLDGCLPPEAIAALGGPGAFGIAPANLGMLVSITGATAFTITLSWAGRNGPFQVETTTNFAGRGWQNIGSPTTNHFITLPRSDALCLYRVKEVSPPAFGLTQQIGGESLLPSGQIVHPAGQIYFLGGRPVDLALSPDGTKAFVKNALWVQVVDVASWRLTQTLNYPADGASMHGIVTSKDGMHLYVTAARNQLYDYLIATDGTLTWSRTITLAGGDPCGVAVSADGTRAYLCLGRGNALSVVDLVAGTELAEINVGVAPWDVALSPDGTMAYVSDWGGRHPVAGDLTGNATDTAVVVDNRGVGASGVVSFVDLTQNQEVAQVPTGLHPSDLELTPDGGTLYVANANSDTVTVIDTARRAVKETILVRPDPSLPFGSDSDGLALSKDGQKLFVAAAGNNAIAVIELPNARHTNSLIQGFVPTDWYPGAVVADSNCVYVVNVKGAGSWSGDLFHYLGTIGKIPIPEPESLSKYTAQVQENCLLPRVLQTQAPARNGQSPLPVPKRVGEPSVFQHVLYIIKENKTYDNFFGDLPQGNGNSNLCLYPQSVSPNHHALATQYVLLDNYYCNGVLSADGHSWAVEGHSTDHIEKSFGGFARGYSLGTECLTFSSSGFIWNNALNHGLTFRNYGELGFGYPTPGSATWSQIYADFTNHAGQIHLAQYIISALLPYTSTNVPGWNLGIPDVVRAQGFIGELHAAESNGVWAALNVLYLPNDHTSGASPGFPTPLAQVADNDLALGQVVEAVTKSRFGSNTCIFIIEDDPQYGSDHVDGHRSICLIASPYTKRRQTVSTFYSQAGAVHTIEQILGLPPMNQHDAVGPLMSDCFTNAPDFTPYTALANNIPLDQMNPGTTAALDRQDRYWANKSRKMDLNKPDLINEDSFNRIIWHSVKGNLRYPSEFSGPHGKGLKRLGLALDPTQKKDDDD